VLLGLAHQRGVPLEEIEVIVAYIPGLDATDDLIDSMRATHPQLRIVRSPFPKANARSKGFMINESARLARGEWFVLLDSDVVLPPDFFARLGALGPEARFVAPDGRKMLTPETTAAVLLGEVRPWEDYDGLLQDAGEYRSQEAKGIPPGFCQCVRREVFEKVPYVELDHFEASDWHFAKTIIDDFGPETRFEDMQVLHLDHGGSQWYGTAKHM